MYNNDIENKAMLYLLPRMLNSPYRVAWSPVVICQFD